MADNKFSNRTELYAIPAPTDRPSLEVWNTANKGFGARIMRARRRTGEVHRVYLARFTDAQGKDKKEVLGEFDEIDYDDAVRRALDLRSAVKHERKTGRKPLPTLGAALDAYLLERKEKLSDSTVADYRKRWGYLSAWHDENVVVLNDERWAERYAELLAVGRPTADGVLRIAHAVYQSLVDDDRMTRNPVRRIATKRQIFAHSEPRATIIKRTDLPKVWRWLETRAHTGVRDWVRIALFTGLRDAVIGGLRWENVNIEDRLILVPAEERGNKAKRLVWIPLSDWLFDNVILPRWNARLSNNPWVIPSNKKAGAPLTHIQGSLATLERETGGVHVNPHCLRRTFGTIARQAVGSQLMVSRMLSHTHSATSTDNAPAVTAGYTVTEDDELRNAFNAQAAQVLTLVADPTPK